MAKEGQDELPSLNLQRFVSGFPAFETLHLDATRLLNAQTDRFREFFRHHV
jgi:hypothetical protein